MAERRKSYAELLKDPRWQKKRLQILERDNWLCTTCSAADKTLHVHHRFYEPGWMPWEYPDETMDTLCEPCHEKYTAHYKVLNKMLGLILPCEVLQVVGYMMGLHIQLYSNNTYKSWGSDANHGFTDSFNIPYRAAMHLLESGEAVTGDEMFEIRRKYLDSVGSLTQPNTKSSPLDDTLCYV